MTVTLDILDKNMLLSNTLERNDAVPLDILGRNKSLSGDIHFSAVPTSVMADSCLAVCWVAGLLASFLRCMPTCLLNCFNVRNVHLSPWFTGKKSA